MKDPKHVRNIFLDLFLTIITFGLFNLYVQAVQMDAVNDMIRVERYSFWKWLLFSLVTFGLYHIYHEYRKSQDIEQATQKQYSQLPLVSLLLALFGLPIVADALQQSEINKFYGKNDL